MLEPITKQLRYSQRETDGQRETWEMIVTTQQQTQLNDMPQHEAAGLNLAIWRSLKIFTTLRRQHEDQNDGILTGGSGVVWMKHFVPKGTEHGNICSFGLSVPFLGPIVLSKQHLISHPWRLLEKSGVSLFVLFLLPEEKIPQMFRSV